MISWFVALAALALLLAILGSDDFYDGVEGFIKVTLGFWSFYMMIQGFLWLQDIQEAVVDKGVQVDTTTIR